MRASAASRAFLTCRSAPQITFQLVMDTIDELYDVSEVAFSVGDVASTPGQNMGSAKIFSFGKMNQLEESTVLNLFGDYYRKDVVESPDGDDHGNIRAFIKGGWDSVKFPDGYAIAVKTEMTRPYQAMGFEVIDCY